MIAVRRLCHAAVVVAGATGASVVAAPATTDPPEGRVVRIERNRATSTSTPLLCEVRETLEGTCVGGTPMVGDMIYVADQRQMTAAVRIESARQAQCAGYFTVTASMVRGQLAQRARAIGISDANVDGSRLRAVFDEHQLQLPHDADGKAVVGVDRDGNGSGDVMLVFARCPGSTTHNPECLEMWSRRGATFKRTWQVELAKCTQ